MILRNATEEHSAGHEYGRTVTDSQSDFSFVSLM